MGREEGGGEGRGEGRGRGYFTVIIVIFVSSYLRSAVLGAAAHFGHSDVIENATELFRQWRMENIR